MSKVSVSFKASPALDALLAGTGYAAHDGERPYAPQKVSLWGGRRVRLTALLGDAPVLRPAVVGLLAAFEEALAAGVAPSKVREVGDLLGDGWPMWAAWAGAVAPSQADAAAAAAEAAAALAASQAEVAALRAALAAAQAAPAAKVKPGK